MPGRPRRPVTTILANCVRCRWCRRKLISLADTVPTHGRRSACPCFVGSCRNWTEGHQSELPALSVSIVEGVPLSWSLTCNTGTDGQLRSPQQAWPTPGASVPVLDHGDRPEDRPAAAQGARRCSHSPVRCRTSAPLTISVPPLTLLPRCRFRCCSGSACRCRPWSGSQWCHCQSHS